MTPIVFVELLTLLLCWRANDDLNGRSFTTVDHLRALLEKLEMITDRQGTKLYKDSTLQRYFKRKCDFAEGNADRNHPIWETTKRDLVCRIPYAETTDPNDMKMLRSYPVLLTRIGFDKHEELEAKYLDTPFIRDAVYSIEKEWSAVWDAMKTAAQGAVMNNYRDTVNDETARGHR